eukprot:GDKJ01028483.1.p1 GENE.GDKJ01028483.1~~GDKJ01028483.1.p1  ORF type:complete len:371 (+),score=66.26 GDKJ01028483.1:1-1113(+)
MGICKMTTPSKEGYVYVPPATSPFYRYCLSPMCDVLCQTFVPMWVHPDVLTVFGLVSALIAAVCTLYGYWVCAAIFWLFYCLMDNMDGKQARRTGMSSPGGEFLDHSCDAIVTTLSVIVWESALFGPNSIAHLRRHYLIWGGQGPYFTSTWAHAVIGRLVLGSSFDGSADLITVDEYNFFFLPGFCLIRGFFPSILDFNLLLVLPNQITDLFYTHLSFMLSDKMNLTVGIVLIYGIVILSFFTLMKMIISLLRPSHLLEFLPLPIYYFLLLISNLSHWTVVGFFGVMIMEQIGYRMHIHRDKSKLFEPLAGVAFLGFFKYRNSVDDSGISDTMFTVTVAASWLYSFFVAFTYRNELNSRKKELKEDKKTQ